MTIAQHARCFDPRGHMAEHPTKPAGRIAPLKVTNTVRLDDKLARLYLDDTAGVSGKAYHADAAKLLDSSRMKPGLVDLVVTSPPYLQVVNYGTANWIRLWLLGIDEVGRERAQNVSGWTQVWTTGTPTSHTASLCCTLSMPRFDRQGDRQSESGPELYKEGAPGAAHARVKEVRMVSQPAALR